VKTFIENQGNFIEMIKILASYNEKVATVVLKKILETLNFALLLMKHEMSLKENKWLLF
jgi:hypothetical protein